MSNKCNSDINKGQEQDWKTNNPNKNRIPNVKPDLKEVSKMWGELDEITGKNKELE